MSHKKLALVGLLGILLIGVAYGAVLEFYGKYVAEVDVHQSVLLDDQEGIPTIVDELSGAVGGETFCYKHFLHNVASVPAKVKFATSYDPELVDNEIVTTYWLPIEYSETIQFDYGVVTIETVECAVKWTIDLDEVNGPFKNGHAGIGLMIGLGKEIKYQVHSNDGTCATYPWGTFLLSHFDQTLSGYFGWHTSEEAWSIPVEDVDDIDASGCRYIKAGSYDGDMSWGPVDHEGNPDLIFTITIAKRLLSCGEFKWALWINGDRGWAVVTPNFEWSDANTANFATAKVGEPVPEPLILPPCVDVDFIICYSFAMEIEPDSYTITTEVQPYLHEGPLQ